MSLSRKAAYVDLQTRRIFIEPIPMNLRQRFLGGRGLNMYLLSQSYSSALDPLCPENPLIFGAGLLTGCLSFGSRINITARSPESGHIGDANMGGDFGAELVKAGISHVIITGRSHQPVYLLIRNESIEIRDARFLHGLDSVATQTALRQELKDSRMQVACIGPAGENLVRFAGIRSGLKSSAARTGMGAVMGSKNLKAVAVRGNLDISVAEPHQYLEYYRSLLHKLMGTKWAQALSRQGTPLLFQKSNDTGFLGVCNNQFTTAGEAGSRLSAEALEPYSTGMLACYSCPVHCRHRFALTEGTYTGLHGEGPEYASIGSLGSKLGIFDLEKIMYAVDLCNRYGLDTISTGSYIAWAMELFQRGIIGEETTGLALHWGNADAVIELIHQIAWRKGFGNILAEGSAAVKLLGSASDEYLLAIKQLPIEMTDERLPKALALGMATASRGACHMRSRPSIDVLGLPEEILEKIYGSAVSNDLSSYVGKARMVWWHELLNAVADSLGLCRFLTLFSSIHAPQYEEFSTMLRLAVGLSLTPAELMTLGERVYTLERLMLVKDGITRQHDTLPKRYFEEPVPDGPAAGEVISRPAFECMLDDYYHLHGWDSNGVPLTSTLITLGLAP
ncbi:MAG TPA: aldehyde ferredoxin oxidoreductase family protein [Thermodesulfobacteriota bacterium]|nr:aldehyde ferredoxin oxidoreductase family protein [Thermodesulfobacteriota bacterium]HOC38544.1 aldehyde ferredoxin oxidoreductase family protein [Thermodesulfobacteriota bacterium]